MAIRLLISKDQAELENYLSPYKAHCMFICNNLKVAGIEYKNKSFYGDYFGYFDEETNSLKGVIVHYWNGMILMCCPNSEILSLLSAHLKKHKKRPISGVSGTSDQAKIVIEKLELGNIEYKINRDEGFYSLKLNALTKVIPNFNYNILRAKEVKKTLLVEWMKDYEIEALGALSDSSLIEKAEIKANHLIQGDCYVLLEDTIPVSLSAFNARLEDMVQVGPVWTPLEQRNQSFAKFILNYALNEAKKQGILEAILFTANPPAIKAYEALGFKKIGNYRLALLKNPLES